MTGCAVIVRHGTLCARRPLRGWRRTCRHSPVEKQADVPTWHGLLHSLPAIAANCSAQQAITGSGEIPWLGAKTGMRPRRGYIPCMIKLVHVWSSMKRSLSRGVP